ADRAEQVPMIVNALREHDRRLQPADQTFGAVHSILEVIPPDQDQRIDLLKKIRGQLESDLVDLLDDKDRNDLLALKPPADDKLKPITPADLPPTLRDQLTEKDGRI